LGVISGTNGDRTVKFWRDGLDIVDGTPNQFYGVKPIVVTTNKSTRYEKRVLGMTFSEMTQIKLYSPTGCLYPNSNSFAHALLDNAFHNYAANGVSNDLAPGWDYKGYFGYGGFFFDRYGNANEYYDEWQKYKQDHMSMAGGPTDNEVARWYKEKRRAIREAGYEP
jgi:hypothetical protein